VRGWHANRLPSKLAVCSIVAGLALSMAASSRGQEPSASPAPAAAEGASLAKKLANPVSDLVSVPFQFNWSEGVGPNDQTQFLLNVQPVMPFALSQDWNLILRAIVPSTSCSPSSRPSGRFRPATSSAAVSVAAHPDTGPKWKIRAAIVILLPRKK
jgi:hypothetical protein